MTLYLLKRFFLKWWKVTSINKRFFFKEEVSLNILGKNKVMESFLKLGLRIQNCLIWPRKETCSLFTWNQCVQKICALLYALYHYSQQPRQGIKLSNNWRMDDRETSIERIEGYQNLKTREIWGWKSWLSS